MMYAKRYAHILGLALFLPTFAFAQNFSSPSDAQIKEKLGQRCSLVEQCGNLSYVDCGSAMDGPAYYIRNDDLSIVMRCGGTCMAPQMIFREGYCTECPPKEWNCGAKK